MELHPRHEARNKAKKEFWDFVLEWEKRNSLTISEMMVVMSEFQRHIFEQIVRDEGKEQPTEKGIT